MPTRPRADDRSPNYIVSPRKLVHFPTQAEAELRRGNRRRTLIARASLVTVVLSPLILLSPLPIGGALAAMLAVSSAALFVAICINGAHANERS